MKVSDKYKIIFGSIDSLDVPISWTSGLSNMLEWLIWETQYVLGVTKTQFRKTVVEWSLEEVNRVTFVNELQDKMPSGMTSPFVQVKLRVDMHHPWQPWQIPESYFGERNIFLKTI
jgi:hypothetical protein